MTWRWILKETRIIKEWGRGDIQYHIGISYIWTEEQGQKKVKSYIWSKADAMEKVNEGLKKNIFK